MRVIKLGAISLVVFAVIIYLFSLLIPSQVRISRAMTIARPKDAIAGYIADMRTWPEWNKMITEQDSLGGIFERSDYSSSRLKVKVVSAGKDSVITSWKHGNSPAIHSGFYLVQNLSDTTVAQWYFDFQLKWYPWEKFGSIIFDQQLGPGMESSLLQLKNIMENRATDSLQND